MLPGELQLNAIWKSEEKISAVLLEAVKFPNMLSFSQCGHAMTVLRLPEHCTVMHSQMESVNDSACKYGNKFVRGSALLMLVGENTFLSVLLATNQANNVKFWHLGLYLSLHYQRVP